MSPRHLYFHIPFCHRICPYCAFYKHQAGAEGMKPFVDALLQEIEAYPTLQPKTLYFGGGTPSLLNKALLESLFAGLHERLDLSSVEEWTMEANPKTFDAEKAAIMVAAGVNRVSLGVQSWQPDLLTVLGRDHQPDEARAAYETLVEAGFPVVNVDLMFSLPGQAMSAWLSDLEFTLGLQPKHVSAYNLTYEEDTAFFDQLGKRPGFADDDEQNADLFYAADALLTSAGYRHYEISNYARPGMESAHNRAYWEGADYLGFGPSAVSTVGGKRWRNIADTNRYVATVPQGVEALREGHEELSDGDFHNERVALLLRTDDGLPTTMLHSTLHEMAETLIEEGVIVREKGAFRLSSSHRAMVDPVAAELFL